MTANAAAEIGALYQEKTSWTPAQRKMESQLIHALKKNRGETYAPGAPNLQLDVKMQPDGRVLVDIKAAVTPALLQLIVGGGGKVVSQAPKFHAIRALVALGQLETLAASGDVRSIRRAAEAYHNTGSVDSEGDTTHLAAAARAMFGVSGAGVTVGVLSDSEDFLADSQSTGDLGPVTVLPGQSGEPGTGEGTAMMEIIHDLAPDAALYFATAGNGEASFAQNILDLRSAGCDIIVDDEGYFDESPFQDGVIAQAVNTVAAGGALYFSAAGNSGNLDSGTSGTWEGDFVDGGAAVSPITEGGRLHSFGGVTYDTVASGGSERHVDLFWSDPLGAASDDYDVFVLDSTGSTVVQSSTSTQDGTQDPYESISSLSVGQRIVNVKFYGAARFLHLDTGRGQLTIATSGATVGHSAASNDFCVAAVDVATAYPNAFTGGAANPIESFSSDGPRHVFFHADGTAITPGNFSSTGGAVWQKPDIAAADGVSTSLPSFTPFFGTSAAAPHAAAIAALLKSYAPGLTPAQIRLILTSSALDIMAPGIDQDSGAGIVMAEAALEEATADPLLITPRTGFFANGSIGGPFNVTAQSFTLTDIGGTSFNFAVINTSAWLNVSPASGTLTSGGATVTVSLNAASSNLAVGVYTANIIFSNLTTHVTQNRAVTLTVTPPSAYANAVLALKPLAYWRLNETNQPPPAGVATNAGSLGGAGTGFEFSGVLAGEPGNVGTSFRFFDPSLTVTFFGSHVDVPASPVLNPNGPFTVEFWAMPAQLTTDLFSPACSLDLSQNGSNSRNGWIFYQAPDNTWQFRVGGFSGYTATISGGTAQANVWQHIVGVYDGANASLYVNGQLVAGPISAAGFAPNTFAPFRLGATTIPNRTYDGWVDEAAFYTNALSASVILAHYNAVTTNNAGYGALILASHPVIYLHLDDPAVAIAAPGTLPVAVNIGSLAPNANGIYQPGSLPGAPGVPNAAFGAGNVGCLFSGAGFIDIPGTFLNLTGPLTLSAWAKAVPATGSTESILDKGGTSYRLLLDGSGLPHFADGAQPGGNVIGPNRVDDGQWHQLTGVFDGTNSQALYIDGQFAASETNATTPVAGNSGDLWIGGDPDSGASQFFNGVIDEVAIFTNALSAAQIQQLFFSATNVVVSPPKFTLATVSNVPPGGRTLNFTWSAVAGRKYQLQFKTNLTQTTWSNLNSSIAASNSTVTVSDGINTNAQRFYRVILLP